MNTSEVKKKNAIVILILGAMTALGPFSIDMYLPSFQVIATDLGTTVARISLSLSSYFVGIASGQLFYGPFLDRFGRKKPVYVGLMIYIVASFFCLQSKTSDSLIAWRFIQALGGCAAGVASMAMVRDLFTTKESAKVFSLLILIFGVSPLLAPTVGGYLAATFGWHSIFVALIVMAILLSTVMIFILPESHQPDPSISLKIGPILKNYFVILRNPKFCTYAVSGAIAFSGLFVYLAGSPIIFMQTYGVNSQVYGWIFAIVAAGLIGSSQFNVMLLKKYSNKRLLVMAISGQVCIAALFVVGTYFDIFGLIGTVFMLFLFLACFGIANPNAGALALAPFTKNAGSASALIGFLQMATGAAVSMCIGIFDIDHILPVITIMLVTSSVALIILIYGNKYLDQREQLLLKDGQS